MSVVVPMERDAHGAVQALLPWYARGQLDSEEMSQVRSHLQTCERCRAELDGEPNLQALLQLLPAAAPQGGVEAGLARMRARLQDAEPREPPEPAAARAGGSRWLGWTLGLQSLAIAALLAVLVWPQAEAPAAYRALATPGGAAAAQALIMFKPETREAQIRRALDEVGATLVGGPTETGAWLLQLPAGDHAAAIERLRAQAGVSLVQSLEAGPAR